MDDLSSLIQCLEQASLQGLQTEVEFAGTILSSIRAHINSRLQDRPRESVIRKEESRKKDILKDPKKKLGKESRILQENCQENIYNVSKNEISDQTSKYTDEKNQECLAPQTGSVIKFGMKNKYNIEPMHLNSYISSEVGSKLDFQLKVEKEAFEGSCDLGEDINFLDLLTPEVTTTEVEYYDEIQENHSKTNSKVVKELVKDKVTMLSSEEQLYIKNSLKSAHHMAMYAPQVSEKVVLSCQLCDFKTDSIGNPLSELRLHTIEVHFLCALCGAQYETKIDLIKHFEYTHKRNGKYFACRMKECNFQVVQDYRLRKMYYHIRNQHTDILSACRVCHKTFKAWRSLKIHEYNKHNLGRELKDILKMCLQCGHMATRTNMSKHTRNVHSDLPLMKCSLCHYETRKGKERMEKHVKMHSLEKMKCGSCNFSSRVIETLEKHKMRIHDKGGLLMCTSCNFKTGMMKRLLRHEQTHSKERPYKCGKCDYKTKTDYSLKAHSFYHQDPKFLCDKCDYKSCSSANLHSHKIVKHSTVKHECEQCGKLFNYKRHLMRHQANHEGGDMPCNECDKKFYRKDKLNDHLRNEHNRAPVEAKQLTSKLVDPPLLQFTKENNDNILRNHICPQCLKTFTCSKHLSRHKNSVHSELELTCQFCQKTFSRKDKLNVHINFSCRLKI